MLILVPAVSSIEPRLAEDVIRPRLASAGIRDALFGRSPTKLNEEDSVAVIMTYCVFLQDACPFRPFVESVHRGMDSLGQKEALGRFGWQDASVLQKLEVASK